MLEQGGCCWGKRLVGDDSDEVGKMVAKETDVVGLGEQDALRWYGNDSVSWVDVGDGATDF